MIVHLLSYWDEKERRPARMHDDTKVNCGRVLELPNTASVLMTQNISLPDVRAPYSTTYTYHQSFEVMAVGAALLANSISIHP
jgi:hypothetical protein